MKLRRRPSGRRTKPNEGCKIHPKHRQSPGVCSLCLVHKLSELPAPCTATAATAATGSNCSSSSSLPSYCSSSTPDSAFCSSSSSSPVHRFLLSKDQGKGSSFSLLWFSGKNLLTKCRSVAFVSRIKNKDHDYSNKN
ncbi:hypothetical protein HRI_001985900 [Hibiscus trionum]|uniref:Uncharacterized protein n=1 Tax=Hibiscus trionum TaxID=183268 RepID=A0A9W7M0K7_HIBTR|nr:hypothetical protein HRI_001985900 [Hibiscus trionum]